MKRAQWCFQKILCLALCVDPAALLRISSRHHHGPSLPRSLAHSHAFPQAEVKRADDESHQARRPDLPSDKMTSALPVLHPALWVPRLLQHPTRQCTDSTAALHAYVCILYYSGCSVIGCRDARFIIIFFYLSLSLLPSFVDRQTQRGYSVRCAAQRFATCTQSLMHMHMSTYTTTDC